jgi:hypothetical protein
MFVGRAKGEGEMNVRPLIASPPWTSDEDHRLRALAEDGSSAVAIAEHLRRSPDAVRKRAAKLGVGLRRVRPGLKAKPKA